MNYGSLMTSAPQETTTMTTDRPNSTTKSERSWQSIRPRLLVIAILEASDQSGTGQHRTSRVVKSPISPSSYCTSTSMAFQRFPFVTLGMEKAITISPSPTRNPSISAFILPKGSKFWFPSGGAGTQSVLVSGQTRPWRRDDDGCVPFLWTTTDFGFEIVFCVYATVVGFRVASRLPQQVLFFVRRICWFHGHDRQQQDGKHKVVDEKEGIKSLLWSYLDIYEWFRSPRVSLQSQSSNDDLESICEYRRRTLYIMDIMATSQPVIFE